MHSSRGRLGNVEYSILLVMSELSTVRCDRALGLWIAGTRASSVDGELPWRCCGRWTVRWMAVKGSRDRSSDRAAAVASTPGSRVQEAMEGGFLGLRHKTKLADGFCGPSKTADRIFIPTAASRRRLQFEERTLAVG